MNRSPPRRRLAFSLIEMMIVVIIIGIVAAIGLPMLSGSASSRLISAADLLRADLAFAQIESLTHGDDPRVVVFDVDNERYLITTAQAIIEALAGGGTPLDATPIANPAGRVPYDTTFGQGRAHAMQGVGIGAVSAGGDNQLRFGLYGQLDQADDAVITLTSGDLALDITIDPINGEASIGEMY